MNTDNFRKYKKKNINTLHRSRPSKKVWLCDSMNTMTIWTSKKRNKSKKISNFPLRIKTRFRKLKRMSSMLRRASSLKKSLATRKRITNSKIDCFNFKTIYSSSKRTEMTYCKKGNNSKSTSASMKKNCRSTKLLVLFRKPKSKPIKIKSNNSNCTSLIKSENGNPK